MPLISQLPAHRMGHYTETKPLRGVQKSSGGRHMRFQPGYCKNYDFDAIGEEMPLSRDEGTEAQSRMAGWFFEMCTIECQHQVIPPNRLMYVALASELLEGLGLLQPLGKREHRNFQV